MTNIKKRKKHPEPERLWTVAGIAEDWAVSPRTVRRLIADGSLPTVRVRGQVRVLASDAIDYLAARRSA